MYDIVFDFSSSPLGGSIHRLEAYAEYFSKSPLKTHFFIHEAVINRNRIEQLVSSTAVHKSLVDKLILNNHHLKNFNNNTKWLFSYGIPTKIGFAKKNWLHISNVLPFVNGMYGHTIVSKLKFILLKKYFIKSFSNTDVLSAESEYSISLFEKSFSKLKFVSKNGSNEEIDLFFRRDKNKKFKDFAVILGTHKHKFLERSYEKFKELNKIFPELRLMIIGDISPIPQIILNDNLIEVTGVIDRSEARKIISDARYYISTTLIENSFNAAAEGIFLAKESYISSIGPHLELLKDLPYKIEKNMNFKIDFLQIDSANLDTRNLVTWEQVILDIIKIYESNK